MIKIKEKKLKIVREDAEKKAAFLKPEIEYRDGEFVFKIKRITGAKWRLVHNNKSVFALIEGTEKTKTDTIHDVLEFDTKEDAQDEIKNLNLIYEDYNGLA